MYSIQFQTQFSCSYHPPVFSQIVLFVYSILLDTLSPNLYIKELHSALGNPPNFMVFCLVWNRFFLGTRREMIDFSKHSSNLYHCITIQVSHNHYHVSNKNHKNKADVQSTIRIVDWPKDSERYVKLSTLAIEYIFYPKFFLRHCVKSWFCTKWHIRRYLSKQGSCGKEYFTFTLIFLLLMFSCLEI